MEKRREKVAVDGGKAAAEEEEEAFTEDAGMKFI